MVLNHDIPPSYTALFQCTADRNTHCSLWTTGKKSASIGKNFLDISQLWTRLSNPSSAQMNDESVSKLLSKLTYFYLKEGSNILVKNKEDRQFPHDLNQGRMELSAICTFTTTDGGIFFIFFCLGFLSQTLTIHWTSR